MNQNTKSILISAAVAGILSAGTVSKVASANEHGKDGGGKCQEANACKGKGNCHSIAHCGEKDKHHCKTAGNECKGQNSCKNHAFKSTEEDCKAVKGKWSKG